jgi:hypothetical protein
MLNTPGGNACRKRRVKLAKTKKPGPMLKTIFPLITGKACISWEKNIFKWIFQQSSFSVIFVKN